MSEGTHWMVIAIIAAVVLSWGFVAWRNRQRLGRLSTADDSDRIDLFLQRHFMSISVIALGLAGLAQYALRIDQLGLAALGYWFAVVLFINGLGQFIPVNLIGEVPTSTAEPVPNLPTTFETEQALSAPVTMTEPNLASEIIPTDSTEIVFEAESPTLTVTTSLEEIVSATHPTEAVNSEALPKTAAFSVWSGFTQPDSILLTAHEQLLILDTSQQIIYRLNPNGQIVQQWSLPPLPEPNGRNLVLSSDGRHLYITDAQKGLVYAITLED
jgi:hypothetical protein